MSIEKTSKEIFSDTLELKKTERCPVAPHWWGIYKYEVLGLDYKKDGWQDGGSVADVYIEFFEKFKPDWLHLHIGTPRYFKDSEIVAKNGKQYIVINDSLRQLKKEDKYFSTNSSSDEEIVDFPDYLLGSRCHKPNVDLSSKIKIDDYIKKYIHMSAEEIISLGYTDHLEEISKEYGHEVFINVHIPSAICEIFDPLTGYTGFEQGLIAFYDYPGGMRYLLERCYQEQLEWAKAYAKKGAHAFSISEAYISPDMANPDIYRKFVKHIHRSFFAEVKQMGLFPLCYFTGDINPLLEDLTEINISGLMVEESKKNFHLDIGYIRKKIGDRVCVFGNLDSIFMLHDAEAKDIEKEVLKQVQGSKNNFIICNGSPITPGTPVENILTFLKTGREYS
ncbi:MAG: hypothetical protein FJW68_06735 [Actinobacteria bacterium]|nr:hypothetical protein [Actinomycetota bacterium]